MKRKIYNELLKWKQDWNGTAALLIDGARRVGEKLDCRRIWLSSCQGAILKASKEVE